MASSSVRVWFLTPIRTALLFKSHPYSSLSFPRIPSSLLYSGRVYRKFQPLKTWMNGFQLPLSNRLSNSHWKSHIRSFYNYYMSRPACRLSISSIFGFSVVLGSLCFRSRVAYSMDGFDVSVDDQFTNLSHSSDFEEDQPIFLILIRKFLAPVVILLTVLTGWNQPIILAAKVFLILLNTKPSSFSVFAYIEKLRCHSMRGQPFFYRFKPTRGTKVEVEDYTVLHIAKAEFEGKKLTLIGILGSWWILPLPPCEKSLLLFSARIV